MVRYPMPHQKGKRPGIAKWPSGILSAPFWSGQEHRAHAARGRYVVASASDRLGDVALVEHRLRVPLRVRVRNGTVRSFSMFFDTGAASLTVSLESLPEAWTDHLQEGPEGALSIVASDWVESLAIGDRALPGSTLLWAVPGAGIFAGRPFEGVAGASALGEGVVTLEYSHPAIWLSPSDGSDGGLDAVPAAFHPDSRFPRVMAEIGGVSYPMLFDSGASVSMISEAVADEWMRRHPAWPRASGSAGHADMGSADAEALVRPPSVRIGPVTVDAPLFVTRPRGRFEEGLSRYTSEPVVGALAGNVLRHGLWRLDYATGRLYARPAPGPASDPGCGIGIRAAYAGGGWHVKGVLATNDSTTIAALRPEDLLLSVNGTPVSGLKHHEVTELLSAPEGRPFHFEVRRGGATISTEGRAARYI